MDVISLKTLLPSLGTLVKELSIEPSVAFYLWRPILAERITRHDTDQTNQAQKSEPPRKMGESGAIATVSDDQLSSSISTTDPEIQQVSQSPNGENTNISEDQSAVVSQADE
jgi:hypothetical protein